MRIAREPSQPLRSPILNPATADVLPAHRSFLGGRIFLLAFVWLSLVSSSAWCAAGNKSHTVTLQLIEGKDMRFTRLSTRQGLSQSVVEHIVQDDQGFMWFGTQDGLNRYDGYGFKVYKHGVSGAANLSGVRVTALFKDRSGAMWIGVDQFLDRFDPVKETITRYRSDPTDPNSLGGHVYHITQDGDGLMWIATSSGLDKLDPATGRFTHYRHDPQDPGSLSGMGVMDDVKFVGEDRSGTLWVETSIGLNAFDRKTGRASQYAALRNRAEYEHQVLQVYEDRSGTLWINSREGRGLATYDPKTGQFVRYRFQSASSDAFTAERTPAILEDKNGVLWLGTGGSGLVKLDRQHGKAIRYRNDPGDPESLSNNFVFSLYEDREGNIWAGTGGGGVNRCSTTPSAFHAYRKKPGDPNGLDQNFVISVFQDSHGILWIGNDSVLNRLDRRTGRFTFYKHNPADPGSISFGTVLSTIEDRSGTLWFGTHRGGLNRFDRNTGRFKAYRHKADDPNSPSSDVIMRMYLDRTGMLWLGTGRGLDRFDPKTEHFAHYHGTFDRLGDLSISALAEDLQGAMWLGTSDSGLYRFDPTTGQSRAYANDPEAPGTLASNRVNALLVDRSGVLWVGTQQGLNKFDARMNAFTVYLELDGLPNNTVHGILQDSRDSLWVSTNNGLSKFDPTAKTARNYNISDGLAGSEFNSWGAPFESPSGEMFFPGVDGLTAFFPNKVAGNSYVPPVVLSDFRLFGVPVPVGDKSPLQQSIPATRFLTLSHTQSVFSFEFSSLSYADPNRNRYRYRLEGLETKWNETDSNRRFVTYTTLAPGRYVFRVQGSNNQGVWNEDGVSVRIRILPPWWATWWFRAMAALLLGGVIFGGHRLRVKTIEERERRFRTLAEDAPDVIARFGRDLRFSYINPAVMKCTGMPVAAFLGKTIGDLNIPEQNASVWDGALRVVFQAGQSTIQKFDLPTVYGMRSFELRMFPEMDAERSVRSVVMIMRDITERLQAEEAQREAEQKYRSIVEEAIVGIFQSAPSGKYLSVNPAMARMFGYDSPQEFMASITNISEQVYVDPKRGEELRLLLEQHGAVQNFECQVYRKDGSKMWISAHVRAIRKDGQVVFYEGMNEDITERKFLEEQLRQAQKMEAVGKLAGGVAHDFNNLLTVIKGYCGQLLERTRNESELGNPLQRIDDAAERAASLTRQLLAFSRRQVLQPKVLNLNALVANMDKMLRRMIGEDVEMVTVAAPDLGSVRADPGQLEQVIMNLVVNARDAMPEGGRLTVETGNVDLDEACAREHVGVQAGPHVMLAVSDTGMGMDAETQARIFEPFFTTKELGKGTGLGLAMIYGIVKQSSGSIWVYSERGHGTTFKIYFPRVEEQAEVLPREQRPEATIRGTETIVLVEDDRQVRELARSILTTYGYSVLVAENALEAPSLCKQHQGPIHLLVTDVVMPGLSGRELVRQVVVRRPDIKVLYMSGYTTNAVVHHGVLDADTFFLPKPFTPGSLAAKVREVLDQPRTA